MGCLNYFQYIVGNVSEQLETLSELKMVKFILVLGFVKMNNQTYF